MEIAMIILAIGVAFMLNAGGTSKGTLIKVAVKIEKEFLKQENQIKALEKRINLLEQKES